MDEINFTVCYLEVLPAEMLVYLFSFLPTPDKAKLRYVSRRIRCAVQTPSLWKCFIWKNYQPRHDRCMRSLLRTCAKQATCISVSDHVTPSKLVNMVQHCLSVRHLTLPLFNFKQVTKLLWEMTNLRTLDIRWTEDISPLLSAIYGTDIKEVTIRIKAMSDWDPWDEWCLEAWIVEEVYLPPVLNIVTKISQSLQHHLCCEFLLDGDIEHPDSTVKLFDSSKVPLNLHPPIPVTKLKIGPSATLPYIKAGNHGLLLGVMHDTLEFIEYDDHGKTKYVAALNYYTISFNKQLDSSINSLLPITYFDAAYFGLMYSGHLEQLAIACPNLEQLNLRANYRCLRNLQGLRCLIAKCLNLQGLNLAEISVYDVESFLQLWLLLSCIKNLTHLAVSLCMLKPSLCPDGTYKQTVMNNAKRCFNLQAIEVYLSCTCKQCKESGDEDILLPHFPSLLYCRIFYDYVGLIRSLHDHPNMFNQIVRTCHNLQYLCYDDHSPQGITLPISISCFLQQLCIESMNAHLTDAFLNMVSLHGGLEHVVFYIQSLTINGIDMIIENSPKLLTFCIVTRQKLYDEHGIRLNLKLYRSAIKKKYSQRSLFTIGTFSLVHWNQSVEKENLLTDCYTDLCTLWGI